MGLKIGSEAPLFELSSTLTKEKLKLVDFRNKKNILIAFYPLDFTPG
jgi:peroxiredoxin